MLGIRVAGRRSRITVLAGLALALFLWAALTASPASAATSLTVSQTADTDPATGPCSDASIKTAPSPLSLRDAVCIANNVGGTVNISVPAGRYTLLHGELSVGVAAGDTVNITGAGQASTILDGNGTTRVLEYDKATVGGISGSVSNLTITNGAVPNGYAGAAIASGSAYSAPIDTLTLDHVTASENVSNAGKPTDRQDPGGAVFMQGGALTVTDSTFTHNTAYSSPGGALWYTPYPSGSSSDYTGQTLTMTRTTFDSNYGTNSDTDPGSFPDGGGAVVLGFEGSVDYSITDSHFLNNTYTTTNVGQAMGGAVYIQTGHLTMTGSTLAGNHVTATGGGQAHGGAIALFDNTAGTHGPSLTLNGDRVAGNVAPAGNGSGVWTGRTVGSTVVPIPTDVQDDWWGCNGGPGATGCDTLATSATAADLPVASRWLTFTGSASPSTITGPSATSTITSGFSRYSDGTTVDPLGLGGLAGTSVAWSDPQPGPGATINAGSSASTAFGSTGQATVTYDSGSSSGAGHVKATLDNETATIAINVDAAPAITTNPSNASAHPGDTVSFTADASGFPTPTVQWQRDTGSGFANIAGATAKTYTFTAAGSENGDRYRAVFTNSVSSATTSAATLTVTAPPAFTSADQATFVAGQADAFTVTTSGTPTPTVTATNTLPAWLTLASGSGGTATLSGTPPAGSGGTYEVDLKAANGTSPDATQTFTLTVHEPPAITSADHTTFAQGDASTFEVTSTGTPDATISATNSLPAWLSLAPDGAGKATLSGTPPAGSGGTYEVDLKADNGTAPAATQTFTLTVDEVPAITSADHSTFTTGQAGTFEVTTTGHPDATISATNSLPAWLTLAADGAAKATLSGTPPAGSGGTYEVDLKAANGTSPDATQTFTLTVHEAAAISSADHATFTIGDAASFAITGTGFPPPTISESGSLPSGLGFTAGPAGSATIHGTPAPGTAASQTVTLHADNGVGTAADQSFTVTVVKRSQTITVTSAPPAHPQAGDTETLSASSDSGLPVAYSVDPATTGSACTLTGRTVHFEATGRCVIDFDQAGDDTYSAAPQVQQTSDVGAMTTSVGLTSSHAPSVFGQPVRMTATVTGADGGSVQFSVDGADQGSPVHLSGGHATSGDLTGLTPGSHVVAARYIPADPSRAAPSDASLTQVVEKAASALSVSVQRRSISAAASPVAPGAGTPTGNVTFRVGDTVVGTAALANGVATLDHAVKPGATRTVSASYDGDTDFTGSSASTARMDPELVAHVSSRHAKSRFGWYRSPVTVSFTCVAHGGALTGPCPARVTLSRDGGGQSVTRTITARDGGAATAVVKDISIDRTAPRVSASMHRGTPRCKARDGGSGVASCRLTAKSRHGTVHYRAIATDRAGNRSTVKGSYRRSPVVLLGARLRHGAYDVRANHTYTLVVQANRRPRYFDAAVVPHRPVNFDKPMLRAGHHRWALGVTMAPRMDQHRHWNLGVKIRGVMYLIRVRMLRS